MDNGNGKIDDTKLQLDHVTEKIANTNPQPITKIPQTTNGLFNFLCRVKWSNVILLSLAHAGCIYGFYRVFECPVKTLTLVISQLLGIFTGFGITVGAHRLWAHRSFKARPLLKLGLLIFNSMCMNGSVYSYARDHRAHHKYTDTDADPKNTTRGFFYAHYGWWMLKKSDTVIEYGKKIDCSDLRNDPLVWFQHRTYILWFLLFGVTLPTVLPHFVYGETFLNAFFIMVVARIVISLNHNFCVNSVAHFIGYRPYDFRMRPTENRLVTYVALGEGGHNYHHVFAHDYANSEKKWWEAFNPSTLFIDICELLHLAYDKKRVSPEVIRGTIERIGVPAYFDRKLPLYLRILNGLADWIVGLCVLNWPAFIVFPYKALTNQPLFVF